MSGVGKNMCTEELSVSGALVAALSAGSAEGPVGMDARAYRLGTEPRCCRTHTLEHRALAARFFASSSSSSLAVAPPPLNSEETAVLEALHTASDGDSWLVIVGGEHGGIMREDPRGTRPGPFLAGHASLQWVGIAFERLLPFFGRERIIVVAQLQETLNWLREASSSEVAAERLAGRTSLLPMLRSRLVDFERDCARLLQEGGADYDGEAVNPATLVGILSGDAGVGGRVLPTCGVANVTLLLVSHGHAHPSFDGAQTHEWYMHFPYPAPSEKDHLYDVVSHRGFESVDPHPDWDWGAPKYRWKLYSQMLFKVYHDVLEKAPWRRHLLVHQFCLSGGAANFMRQLSYQNFFGTRGWPIFAITTAGRFEPSLGNFIDFWTDEFSRALREGGNKTLGAVYKTAEQRYWEANPDVKTLNSSLARADDQPPADDTEATTVGTIGHEAGMDGRCARSMDDVPVQEITNTFTEATLLSVSIDVGGSS